MSLQIKVRLSPQLKRWWCGRAKRNFRSLSAEIAAALQRAMELEQEQKNGSDASPLQEG